MIPTMLIAGVIAGFLPGRWALAAVVALGLVWGGVLWAQGTVSGLNGAAVAAALGGVNALASAAAPQALRWGIASRRDVPE